MAQLISRNRQTRREQTDLNEWNILHFAARYDRLEILDMFVRDEKFFVEYAEDKNGNTPLQIACKYGKY